MKSITVRFTSFMILCAILLGSTIQVRALSEQQKGGNVTGAGSIQTQALTDDFNSLDNTLWKNGYSWGTTDVNMGNSYAANASIVKDTAGSYLCLKSPAQNNIGAVTSLNQFGFGTYAARIKFTASNGTWPIFWGWNEADAWEIDGLESLGNDPTRAYMTLHDDHQEIGQGIYTSSSSLANQWHVYSFTWTSTSITMYFDSVKVYSKTYSNSAPLTIMFTNAIMGNGVLWNNNKYDSTTFANGTPTMCVDYFSFTPVTAASTPTTTATSIPPTATRVPNTATPIPASPTALPPTSTPLPSFTPTQVLPTATVIPTFTSTVAPASTAATNTTYDDTVCGLGVFLRVEGCGATESVSGFVQSDQSEWRCGEPVVHGSIVQRAVWRRVQLSQDRCLCGWHIGRDDQSEDEQVHVPAALGL
ncbi:MAG: family 16 glycosylhydrolase [Anaerolineales bacterium]